MALQDDAMNRFLGWQSADAGGPITSGAGYRNAAQDIIQATFDPQGAAHTKYAADKAAEEAAKVQYAADQAKYQQDLATYNQESARIAAENAARLAQPVTAAPAAPAATTGPSSFREYLAQQGYNRQSWQGTTVDEANKLKQQWGAVRGQGAAGTPGAAPTEPTRKGGKSPTEPIAPESLWKSYDQYFADNKDALQHSMYHTTSTTPSAGNWGATGDPYRYSMEYNKYKSGLPLIYQDLINYGISPEQVASGQAKSIARQYGNEIIPTDYNEAMKIYGTTRGGPSDQGIGLKIQQPTQPTNTAQWTQLPKM